MATEQWDAILQNRLGDSEYAEVRPIRHPLTQDEEAWYLLIRERSASWESQLPAIVELYAPALPPPRVLIVAGNRGASDAFVHDAQTIGFDLSTLQAEYGSARLPENVDRIDRLFRHEYSHLMQKAWLAIRPYAPNTPMEHALLDIWLEGLGTYHSFSQPWRATHEGHSARARDALATMEPRFVVRLAALSCSGPENVARLTADLSQGPFRQKWGSLPAGLWIELDSVRANRPEDALRSVIQAGPDGIWDLAMRHLRPELRSALEETRNAERLCRE